MARSTPQERFKDRGMEKEKTARGMMYSAAGYSLGPVFCLYDERFYQLSVPSNWFWQTRTSSLRAK